MSATVQRVILRNYRSIADCDVHLGPLTMLVGPNGSGKSNFLDALAFTSEGLTSLEEALNRRGGFQEVRRRSSGTHFSIVIELQLKDGALARYAFQLGAQRDGGFLVMREQAQIGKLRYEVRRGQLKISPAEVAPPASDDRLYLPYAAGLPEFRPLFEAIIRMKFYTIHPQSIRSLSPSTRGDILTQNAWNIASVIRQMKKRNPQGFERLLDYLRAIVPGLVSVSSKRVTNQMTLEFSQQVDGHLWRFPAIAMSDGTLRALGVLVAIFQRSHDASAPSLTGIEEPETALHPAASGVLFDALQEASRYTQILLTTHSPDLLDHPNLKVEELRAVMMGEGKTLIGPIDAASAELMRDELCTAGELIRDDQIRPVAAVSKPLIFKRWKVKA